jgi:long-subunit acyl-CoA synthetase (AMP-forming)
MGYRPIKSIKKMEDEKTKKPTEWKITEFEKTKFITYGEALERIKNIGKGIKIFSKLNAGDKLAIFENTCAGNN